MNTNLDKSIITIQSRKDAALLPGVEAAIAVSGLNQNLTCIDGQSGTILPIVITSGGRPSRAIFSLSNQSFGNLTSTYNPGNSYNYTTFSNGVWSTVEIEIFILNYFLSRLIFTPANGCQNVSISATVIESISNYAARGTINIRALMPNVTSVTPLSSSTSFPTTSASTLVATSSSAIENTTLTTQSQTTTAATPTTTNKVTDSTYSLTTPISSPFNTTLIPQVNTSISTTSAPDISLILPMESADQPPYAIIGAASTVTLACFIAAVISAKKCWFSKREKSSQVHVNDPESGIQNQYVNLALVKPELHSSPNTTEKSTYDTLPTHLPFDYDNIFINLQEAAKTGDCGLIEILLSSGIPVDSVNAEGYTALQLAAIEGQEAACRLLVSRGADKNLTTPEDKTALDLARENNHLLVIAFLENSSSSMSS